MITVEFPLSAAKITISVLFLKLLNALLSSFVIFSGGCFVLLNMLHTMPLNLLASFSSSLQLILPLKLCLIVVHDVVPL